MRKWLGLKALVHDAVDDVVDLVWEGHESTARNVQRVADATPGLTEPVRTVDSIRRFGTRSVLGSIKAVNRLVEAATNAGLDAATKVASPGTPKQLGDGGPGHVELEDAVPLRSDAMQSPTIVGDALVGLVNGALGHRLDAKENGLDLGLVLRAGDHYADPASARFAPSLRAALASRSTPPSARASLFVHGLMTTEWSWVLEAASYHGDPTTTFGTLLERDLGITPLYVRYNTGRHISRNGRALDAAIEALVDAYPVPLEELVLVGHSMGGLVLRSACHYGTERGARWPSLVRRVFSLGSPHRGAPVESLAATAAKLLARVDLPGTLIPARILEGRSAGIKDLREGDLVEAHWLAQDPDARAPASRLEVPLLPGVRYFFVSASVTRDPAHPLGHLVGDLLVREDSALGPREAERHFDIEQARFAGVLHHQLQNHPDVYDVIRAGCTSS